VVTNSLPAAPMIYREQLVDQWRIIAACADEDKHTVNAFTRVEQPPRVLPTMRDQPVALGDHRG